MRNHNKRSSSHSARKAWKSEISNLIRGASGGFLFGIPLLYTISRWKSLDLIAIAK